MLPFQHNLQRLGIVMDIRQVDNSQYSNRRRSRYDMMPSLWRAMPGRGPTCTGVRLYSLQQQRRCKVDKLIAQILQWQGNKQTDPSRSGAGSC